MSPKDLLLKYIIMQKYITYMYIVHKNAGVKVTFI